MSVNVTFPEDVLSQIDAYAERGGFIRNGFLAQAAKKAMVAWSASRIAPSGVPHMGGGAAANP
ncbi:MAG TPA: type II toxin-antitoxin system HicB family antitoxin [Pseudolabrys sp.]|nr:type II toxin-antitoxin system HicB family antitoxin [Pseudolabrys sp.]